MIRRNCIVRNCESSSKATTMHKFPKNPCFGEQWINAIRNPILKNLPYHVIQKKRYVVCNLHFEKNSYFESSCRKRLLFDAVPTLGLPDLQSSEAIQFNSVQNNLNQLKISLNDEYKKDETLIANIFSLDDFSPSFKYSDSPIFEDITKLPIRGRDICENFESEPPMSTRPQLVPKIKSSSDNSETISRSQLYVSQKRASYSENSSRRRLILTQESNRNISELQNGDSDFSEIINRPESDYMQKADPDCSEKTVKPQLDSLMKRNQDVLKRRKRHRLELQNGNLDIAEGPASVQIERVQDITDNARKDNAENVAAFEMVEYDQPLEGENKKMELTQLFVGQAKQMEFTNLGREAYNKGKDIKYRTTIRLKRQSNKNGEVQEDVFLIEHSFISTCNICPNHGNDKVSCKVVKVE